MPGGLPFEHIVVIDFEFEFGGLAQFCRLTPQAHTKAGDIYPRCLLDHRNDIGALFEQPFRRC